MFKLMKLMNLRFQFRRRKGTLLLAVLLGRIVAVAGPSEPAASARPSTSPGATATNVVVEIPQSVFEMPSATDAVKDPFFPNSTRYAALTTTKTNTPAALLGDLVLKGLSGRPDAPLATINNITFGVGEEREVRILTGRVRVRCVEINLKDEIVVIEAGGQRRELRFPRLK